MSGCLSLWSEMLRDEDIEQLIMAAIKWAAERNGRRRWAVLHQVIAEDRIEPVIQLMKAEHTVGFEEPRFDRSGSR